MTKKQLLRLMFRMLAGAGSPRAPRSGRVLAVLLAIGWSLGPAGAATYYAAVNGSSSNSGVSSNSPWPLTYALANCGAGSTVIVLPGTYTSEAWIQYPYVTLKSQVKWGARIVGGSPSGVLFYPETVHDATVDGFEIASSAQGGIELYGSNCVVRNCWVHDSGAAHPNENGGGIIVEGHVGGHLFENNLCENNGYNEGGPWNHGLYLTGNDNVVRNNVFRFNWGCGIALRVTTATNYVYNNLTYKNHYYGFGGSQYPNGTYVMMYNNTFVETNWTFYGGENGAGYAHYVLHNNIIVGGAGINLTGDMLSGDYNVMNASAFSQAHGTIVSDAQFVNPAKGLYWLAASSPARGKASANFQGPVDFFGNAQSTVTDVGAFQFNSAYAADTRTLEPSPAGGANYWLQLAGGSGGGGGGGGTTNPPPVAATTYYAAVSGSSANTGLSTSSPWPLDYALANCGASNTVVVLPGTYNFEAWIQYPYVTLKSQVKWGARLVGGNPCGVVAWPETVHDATIDGFEIASSAQGGIELYGSNCVVRNCWVHDSGASHPTQNGGGIIVEGHVGGHLFENNLSENNGYNEGGPFDHGIYLTGNDNVVRNNVFRYNWGCGIALRVTTGTNYVYNNLTYKNRYYGFGGSQYPNGTCVMMHNNTFVETNYTFYGGENGPGYAHYLLTNNIIFGGVGINLTGDMLSGDYNLMNGAAFAQAHGAIVSDARFVSPSAGLYWLTGVSAARAMALASVHGPVDFFGNAQSTVNDVGAFQYNPLYAADTRVLDPTPAGGADYWQILGGGGAPQPQTFSFQASDATLSAPFALSNGSVSQTVDTENANGGQAVFTFNTSTAAVFLVSAVVNAPSTAQSSFYVTIDGTPTEPYTVWDIPVTSGFQSRTVSWRGNGTPSANEFVTKAFALRAGTHSLTVMGRQPNVQLQSVLIQATNLTAPATPPVLRLSQ